MNSKILVIACGVVLVGALISLWLTFKTETVRIPQREIIGIQTGLGQALAEETAKVVPDRGRIVFVARAPFALLKQRSKYLWDAFESELRKHSISITVVEPALNAWDSGSREGDRAAFKELLERHTDAGALVFLVDLPEWGRVAEAFPNYAGPKIVAVDNLRQRTKPRYSGYFASGMLAALIAAPDKPVPASLPKTPREWFDRNYRVYTPQNHDSMTD